MPSKVTRFSVFVYICKSYAIVTGSPLFWLENNITDILADEIKMGESCATTYQTYLFLFFRHYHTGSQQQGAINK